MYQVMKYKILAVLLVVLPVSAFAEDDAATTNAARNIVTSKSYVDYKVDQKQDKIGGNTAGTVITNTGTAGVVGTKGVYKTTTAYSSQTDSLIEANHANTAIQNGLNRHVTCADPVGGSASECLLWSINQLSGTYFPQP